MRMRNVRYFSFWTTEKTWQKHKREDSIKSIHFIVGTNFQINRLFFLLPTTAASAANVFYSTSIARDSQMIGLFLAITLKFYKVQNESDAIVSE